MGSNRLVLTLKGTKDCRYSRHLVSQSLSQDDIFARKKWENLTFGIPSNIYCLTRGDSRIDRIETSSEGINSGIVVQQRHIGRRLESGGVIGTGCGAN